MGLIGQMVNYNRETDKTMPQDIVMTLGELTFLARHAPEDMGGTVSTANNYVERRRRSTARRRR